MHLDLKLENILVDKDFNLKIADFGFATNKNVKKLTLFRGTKTYMAPEIWGTAAYDGRKADVFSMGIVIFAIVVGYQPFAKASHKDKYFQMFLQGDLNLFWKKTERLGLSPEFKDLMSKMLDPDPVERISVSKI